MLQPQLLVPIDSVNTDAPPTPLQIGGGEQQSLNWLERVWGLSAIDAIVDSSQGVSETWWRVFKERQTG